MHSQDPKDKKPGKVEAAFAAIPPLKRRPGQESPKSPAESKEEKLTLLPLNNFGKGSQPITKEEADQLFEVLAGMKEFCDTTQKKPFGRERSHEEDAKTINAFVERYVKSLKKEGSQEFLTAESCQVYVEAIQFLHQLVKGKQDKHKPKTKSTPSGLWAEPYILHLNNQNGHHFPRIAAEILRREYNRHPAFFIDQKREIHDLDRLQTERYQTIKAHISTLKYWQKTHEQPIRGRDFTETEGDFYHRLEALSKAKNIPTIEPSKQRSEATMTFEWLFNEQNWPNAIALHGLESKVEFNHFYTPIFEAIGRVIKLQSTTIDKDNNLKLFHIFFNFLEREPAQILSKGDQIIFKELSHELQALGLTAEDVKNNYRKQAQHIIADILKDFDPKAVNSGFVHKALDRLANETIYGLKKIKLRHELKQAVALIPDFYLYVSQKRGS